MSVFQCDNCGCIENTASADGGHLLKFMFKGEKYKEAYNSYKEILGLNEDEEFGEYCCVCNPMWFVKECICEQIPHASFCKKGSLGVGKSPEPKKWHNRFERMFLEKGKWKTDHQGNLRHKETGETDFKKYLIKVEE